MWQSVRALIEEVKKVLWVGCHLKPWEVEVLDLDAIRIYIHGFYEQQRRLAYYTAPYYKKSLKKSWPLPWDRERRLRYSRHIREMIDEIDDIGLEEFTRKRNATIRKRAPSFEESND